MRKVSQFGQQNQIVFANAFLGLWVWVIFKLMRVWVFVSLLVMLHARQGDLVLASAVQSSLGIVLLIVSVLLFYLSIRRPKQLVQFEEIECHPPTPVPTIVAIKDDTSTSLPSSNLKEVSFESDGPSPAERKKRKRKAHRLSDRRRNNEEQQSQEVEQGSDL